MDVEELRTITIREDSPIEIIEEKRPARKSYIEALVGKPRESTHIAHDEEIPIITSNMTSIINQAVEAKDRDIVNRNAVVRIDGSDIKRLSESRWLNDSIVSVYFQLIAERSRSEALPSVLNISSYVYPMMESLGYDSACQFTKNDDIFSHDLLIMPIHLINHWALVVVDNTRLTIKYYDSLIRESSTDEPAHKVYKFLKEEHKERKGRPLSSHYSILWDKSTPQQINGVDCGVYMCVFAERLARQASLAVTPATIIICRSLLIWEIASNQLYHQPSTDLNESLILGINHIEMREFENQN